MTRLRSLTHLLAAAIAASAAHGCATARNGVRAKAASPFAPLTAAEIRRAPLTNAYDLVQHLRPGFLVSRGATSMVATPRDEIVVIINNQAYAGVDELRSVPTAGILWVRRLSAAEVYGRLGRTAPSGGIEIRLGPP